MNLLQVPSSVIGLMGARPRQQNPMLGLVQPQMADEFDQAMFAANPNGYGAEQPQMADAIDQAMFAANPDGMNTGWSQMPSAQPQAPAQRRRVSALSVLGRALAPNITGALDTERARLQAEADLPQKLAMAQENERIARALGPQALLAYRTNQSALGEGLAAQYKPTTTGAGGVSTVFGTGQQVSAPRVMEFGNDLIQADPLTGVERLATRGPSYAEQAQIGRLEQDAAQAEQRLALDYQKLGQDQAQFDQRLGFDKSKVESRPLSATQQKQLETYAQDVVSLEGTNEAIDRYLGQLSSGQLNFGALENIESGIRNRLGLSDDNSRNQALFRSDMERLRNESLRLNSGVQTEGDAQRAWNELFGNLNDSRVVEQQLRRIKQINDRALQFRRGRVADIEGRQFGGGQAQSAPPPPAGFVLD